MRELNDSGINTTFTHQINQQFELQVGLQPFEIACIIPSFILPSDAFSTSSLQHVYLRGQKSME